jgi:membrane protease subunit HflC
MRIGVVVVIVLAVLAVVASSTCYTVHESEYAIVLHFGKPDPQVREPGLHFKTPVVDAVQKYDKRLRVYRTPPITYVLSDKKPIILEAYLCWLIQDPLRFHSAVGQVAEAKRKLRDVASAVLGDQISRYELSQILTTKTDAVQLPKIAEQLRVAINKTVVDELGIEVQRFGINRMALPAANERAVYDRMKAERQRDATKYQAEGRAEADKIRANARELAAKIESDARARAITIRGEAEAEAARISQKAYSKDIEFYKFWKTLETYKRIFGSETTLIIPTDSELMRYFRMSAVEQPQKDAGP